MSSPGLHLLTMARAYRTSQLVYVAAKLRIADLLAGGPKTCDELAAALNASADALCRLMRGLSALGIFEQGGDDRYALTELSRPLMSDDPKSVRAGIIYLGQEQYRAWGDLLQTVMTGEAAFPRLFGDPFQYYDQHPDTGDAFDDWMAAASRKVAERISSQYEFPEAGRVVDVGGGEGVLLGAILKPRPALRGILFDRPSVIEKARGVLDGEKLIDRCELRAGDFRQEVPAGGDVYILKNILHDWPDSSAAHILLACRRAMGKSATLVVIQRTMPAPGAREWRSLVDSDLMQLVYSGGRERTDAEYRRLLQAAGFEVSMTMQSEGATWLTEAQPAPAAPESIA